MKFVTMFENYKSSANSFYALFDIVLNFFQHGIIKASYD